MTNWYYRYTGDPQEKTQLSNERKVFSTGASNATIFLSYGTKHEGMIKNIIGFEPDYRLGPFPESNMPPFVNGPTPVQPRNGNINGTALEVEVQEPIWLFGIWNFNNSGWEEV